MIRLKVQELARAKGLSQSKLSRKSDVDLTTLRKIYQTPTTVNVTLETLKRLARALEVPVAALIEELPGEDQEEM
ncbi:helix-turn-helix domain-containing protein [Ktedonosporobacter rubrisoli]|nr:helix-turn-helix transcriptional regulator [Ktedonosporobacter rubrisoli]